MFLWTTAFSPEVCARMPHQSTDSAPPLLHSGTAAVRGLAADLLDFLLRLKPRGPRVRLWYTQRLFHSFCVSLAALCSALALSSPARHWTHTPWSGTVESSPLDLQVSPKYMFALNEMWDGNHHAFFFYLTWYTAWHSIYSQKHLPTARMIMSKVK